MSQILALKVDFEPLEVNLESLGFDFQRLRVDLGHLRVFRSLGPDCWQLGGDFGASGVEF